MFRDLNRGLLSVFLTCWWSLRHPCLETWCFERRTRLYDWRKSLQMQQTQSGWRLLPDLHNHLWGGKSLVRGWRIRGRHGRRSWSQGSLYFFPTLRLHLLHARTDASCAGLLTSSASDSSQAFWKCPKIVVWDSFLFMLRGWAICQSAIWRSASWPACSAHKSNSRRGSNSSSTASTCRL